MSATQLSSRNRTLDISNALCIKILNYRNTDLSKRLTQRKTDLMRRINYLALIAFSGTSLCGTLILPVKAFLQDVSTKAVPQNTNNKNSSEARKRAQLAPVKHIVVIPLFFGTETLNKVMKPGTDKKNGSTPAQSESETISQSIPPRKDDDAQTGKTAGSGTSNPNLVQYAENLRKLQEDARRVLPERLMRRAGFTVVPEEEVAATLKMLQLTPEKMFENNGRIRGSKFPLPRVEAIRSVSEALHADAIVLGVLDEPRRANGKYFFDPLSGFSYEPGHVEAHGGFYLMLPEGTEALHGYMRVLNPLSKAAGRDFVLPDWIDAQNLMIENLMDEWTYYTPRYIPKKR